MSSVESWQDWLGDGDAECVPQQHGLSLAGEEGQGMDGRWVRREAVIIINYLKIKSKFIENLSYTEQTNIKYL